MGKLFNKGIAAPQQAAQEVNTLDMMSEAQTSGAQAPVQQAATPQVAQPVKGDAIGNIIAGAANTCRAIGRGAKKVAKIATIGLAAYGGIKLVQKFKSTSTESVENTDNSMSEADECISTAQEDHAEEE